MTNPNNEYDAVVIGAGLFGSIIAQELRSHGLSVVIIDDRQPEAGSGPAACLMKPSWFSSAMPKQEATRALELLDRHYGVQDIKFRAGGALSLPVTVHWCDPAKILKGPDVEARASSIVRGKDGWHMVIANTLDGWALPPFRTPRVIVAAGIWTGGLIEMTERQTGQKGMAILYEEDHLDKPFIKVWAPYKQLVAFNRGDGVWVGDGSAVQPHLWDEAREQKIYDRCISACGVPFLGKPPRRLIGIRPYVKRKPCYLDHAGTGIWVATGGAKNGTIAAAWAAGKIAEGTL